LQTQDAVPRGGSPEAIQAHYDVGNDFYRLWLDPTLSYSCAMWQDDEADSQLEAAQRRKIDFHVRSAKAQGAGHVLDIGCGWGALLWHLVHEAGVRQATGLTLSQQQYNHIADLADPRMDVRLESWVDHQPAQPYDALISIGAFEHFARPEWSSPAKVAAYRSFFSHCHRWLKPGAWLSLQTIAYGNFDPAAAKSEPEHRFLLGEIFPEAELPTLEEVIRASAGLFELVALRNDREDYERTCQVWYHRLVARKTEATAVAGAAVVARYLRYLKLSMSLFHLGRTCLLRLALRRLDDPR
jgi:cyclopropane-fatty-acyl-phospholipid synthase